MLAAAVWRVCRALDRGATSRAADLGTRAPTLRGNARLERHKGDLGPDGILLMMTLHNDVADNSLLEFHTLEAGKLVARPVEPMPWPKYASVDV